MNSLLNYYLSTTTTIVVTSCQILDLNTLTRDRWSKKCPGRHRSICTSRHFLFPLCRRACNQTKLLIYASFTFIYHLIVTSLCFCKIPSLLLLLFTMTLGWRRADLPAKVSHASHVEGGVPKPNLRFASSSIQSFIMARNSWASHTTL